MKKFRFLAVAIIIFAALLTSCKKDNNEEQKLNEFTVSFNSNEGSDVPSQTVKEDEKATKPENPTRDGYTFEAWFKEVELTNEWKFDSDVVISDMTLYAKWSEQTGEEDPLYPTTIYRLSEEILSIMREDFAQRNPDIYSSLNHFGFCSWSSDGGTGTPGGFTKEEAIAAVKEFVARNPEYTGVNNPNDLQFKYIESSVIYNDALFWCLKTENQKINGIEVDNTEILFHTQSRKLIRCYGNYFPEIYVPEKFNFNAEQAKSKLSGKEIFIVDWSGNPYSIGFVTEEHLRQATVKLIVVPLETEEKIELRVTWQIHLDSLYYIFEIDVMTGEIIRETPTAIS